MILKEKINTDYMSAFRAKNTIAKNLLSVIKGEIQTVEKNTNVENLSDDEVIKILTKTAKSLKETNTSFPSAQTAEELFIVESYLPELMSADKIREIIVSYKENGMSNLGQMMGEFNKTHKGLADNKLVSEIIKEVLTA